MTESSFFLPSEVARLILGYIKDEGYMNTYKVFLKECSYLAEYVTLLKQGREFPLSVCGITLTMMLDDYARLKMFDTNLETGHTNKALLWKQLECIVRALKLGDPDKKHKSFAQSATQGARMKRQINDTISPQKAFTNFRHVDNAARLAVHTCQRQAKSPTQDCDSNYYNSNDSVINVTSASDVTCVSNITSSDITCVSNVASNNSMTPGNNRTDKNKGVPHPENTEDSNKKLQELLSKNSPNSKSNKGSSSNLESQAHVNTELKSAKTVEKAQPDKQTDDVHSKTEENGSLMEKKDTCSLSVVKTQTGNNLEGKFNAEDSVKSGDQRTTESETILSASNSDIACTKTDLEVTQSQTREVPKTSQKLEASDVSNCNTCDSWYSEGPGVKGGDKLLEKFGIHQSSSSDSTDQEVVEHLQAPVTPSKSRPPSEMGLVTPVKQLQTAEHSNRSPRRKKPKTPRKRLSDVDKSKSRPAKDNQSDEPPDGRLQQVIEPLLHDRRLHEKLAEISTVVLGKTHQNKSHHKSGVDRHEPTPEELETIVASQSLEEILETESFGHDLNLDLSDPVFEGLFRLFGTDKEAFHENLRREKHKTAAMEAEVEELEKSIHEEMVACGTLMCSQGDEGYETQRTQCTDDLYSSPKPSCSSQAGTLETSSPVSQPNTPRHQRQETSFSSSPRDSNKQSGFISSTADILVNSPIHPCSPYSNKSDMFSPASHVTQPFSPALSEHSPVTPLPSTPSHSNTAVFSPARDQILELESPYPHGDVSPQSPTHMLGTHVVHHNPPQSPDEIPVLANRRTPIPCSPLVKNDILPGTPHMVQKYNTPFTPQSKHKSIMAAGTVRHLFSPQVYSPGTRQNAQVMIQTNLENGIPQYTQEVEVNATSQTGTQTASNQSINYTNFVSGVSSADNRSTPINIRAESVFHGEELTTIDNTIGCISLPPSLSEAEMPPPQAKGKGKKGGRGKEKKTQKKSEAPKVQQGGFSTLLGLLSKPPQLAQAEVQQEDKNVGLSMPVLTAHTNSDTVVLNAADGDIHNDSISILSPGGQNYIEVPIIHCQDIEPQQQTDIVSQALSESNVTNENDTVCVWSQNLNTSTQLTVFSPPTDSVNSVPGCDAKTAHSDQYDKLESEYNSKKCLGEDKRKTSKKKLNLDDGDNQKAEYIESVVVKNTSDEFVCSPGEVLTAEPLLSNKPQKKIFMRSLNFGPNAGNTRGTLMPSRKVAQNSALVPIVRKKSSDFSSVSVNLTKDIKYRKIVPKPLGQIPVAINVLPRNHSENTEPGGMDVEISPAKEEAVPSTSEDNHYDSDTVSCGSLSPLKFRKRGDKSSNQVKAVIKHDKQTSGINIKQKANRKTAKGSGKTKNKEAVDEKLNSSTSKILHKRKQDEKSTHTEKHEKVNSDSIQTLSKLDQINVGESDNLENKKGTSDSDQKNGELVHLETLKSKTITKTGRGKAKPKKSNSSEIDSESDKVEKYTKSNAKPLDVSKRKDSSSKKGRKKNEKQLKVKIVSSKVKPSVDRTKATLKSSKSLNKVFVKSPVMRVGNTDKTNTNEKKDLDSDDDVPLIALKGLNKKELFHDNKQIIEDNAKLSNEQNKTSKVQNKELDVPVIDISTKTPEKKTGRSPGTFDTPSKEQVLEKLGLTPKKNAEDILQSMQSPSRNIIDLLVQLTPLSSEKSQRRRKVQSHSHEDPLKSPSRSNKTPAKRLFGSPHKISFNSDNKASNSNNNCCAVKTKESVMINGHAVPESEGDSVNTPNSFTVVNNKEKVQFKPVVTCIQKRSGKGNSLTRKSSLECLKKVEKKLTPLKIKDLYKNTKVPIDRNKESRSGKKRQREDSDQEMADEVKKDKPVKKARNSLDLSVLDYEKMMAKLSKLHK